MIKVICLNDKNKPAEVPENEWIKELEWYHIILITIHPEQGFISGCELAEVSIHSCPKYSAYRLDRFGFLEEDIPALIELIKESSRLPEVDIQKLLDDSNLKVLPKRKELEHV